MFWWHSADLSFYFIFRISFYIPVYIQSSIPLAESFFRFPQSTFLGSDQCVSGDFSPMPSRNSNLRRTFGKPNTTYSRHYAAPYFVTSHPSLLCRSHFVTTHPSLLRRTLWRYAPPYFAMQHPVVLRRALFCLIPTIL
jgi:hypothetical protein